MYKIKYLILFSLLITLFSCSEENIEKKSAVQNDTDNSVMERILSNGFKKEDIVEYKDRYVVEGDIIFYKNEPVADKAKPRSNQRVDQARSPYIVGSAYLNVKVFLNTGSFSSINLNTTLNEVIAEYNNISTTLRLSRVYSLAAADIEIVQNSLTLGVCGQAGFPFSDGRPFNKVYISEYTLNYYGLTQPGRLKLLLAHELGHCFGLRHTNWQSAGESAAIQIGGTPGSETASVMNGSTCGNYWNGFSYFDKIAFTILYPPVLYPTKYILYPNEILNPGQYIQSTDGRFILIMQTDGNLVLYKNWVAIWSSGTWQYPGSLVAMQNDGNLVIYQNWVAKWSSGTWQYPGSILVMQNDANLVIYQNWVAKWATNTWMYN